MNKARVIYAYKPTGPRCNQCGATMNLMSGSRGKFYSCSNYGNTRCRGSMNAERISLEIYNTENESIKNDSRVDCEIEGKIYTSLEVMIQDGCFGVEVDDVGFICLKDCKELQLSKTDTIKIE